MTLPADPQLPAGVHLANVAWRYCSGLNIMSGSIVCIKVMDDLFHPCIVSMILRIYGSLAMQWISGGQLNIMWRVLDGDHFSWGLLLHAKIIG